MGSVGCVKYYKGATTGNMHMQCRHKPYSTITEPLHVHVEVTHGTTCVQCMCTSMCMCTAMCDECTRRIYV